MWKTTCRLHSTLRNKVCYLSSFGEWYHMWSICFLLSIDQCFVLVWWRALLTLSIPFGFPVEKNTKAACTTPYQCNLAMLAGELSFYFVRSIPPKWLFFFFLSDNWHNVFVYVISFFLTACSCLVSQPQHLHRLTLKYTDCFISMDLRILLSFHCNQT